MLVYAKLRPVLNGGILRGREPDVLRVCRCIDAKTTRRWLFNEPAVVKVWGPFDLLSLPTTADGLTDDKIITPASPPPAT